MTPRAARKPRSALKWFVLLIGAGAVVAVAIYVVFWPLSDVIARHDVVGITVPHRAAALQAARDAARGRLFAFGAGLFGAGALIYTARNFSLSREGQVTDRYTKTIEQLGSEKLDVRIGGIYALERVARDSVKDHPTVMEVLSTFVREHSHDPWPSPPGRTAPRPDVQAAVTVIGRGDRKRDIQSVDLIRADLRGARLSSANFTEAVLYKADLTGADLEHAELRFASLVSATLSVARLRDANLRGAGLSDADLSGADLGNANLRGALINGANLRRANLSYADLDVMDLSDADLTRANLAGADLTDANLTDANLTDANLTDARWPTGAVAPAGWQQDAESGRLTRAVGTNSGDGG